jgi:hypothetical protein
VNNKKKRRRAISDEDAIKKRRYICVLLFERTHRCWITWLFQRKLAESLGVISNPVYFFFGYGGECVFHSIVVFLAFFFLFSVFFLFLFVFFCYKCIKIFLRLCLLAMVE